MSSIHVGGGVPNISRVRGPHSPGFKHPLDIPRFNIAFGGASVGTKAMADAIIAAL